MGDKELRDMITSIHNKALVMVEKCNLGILETKELYEEQNKDIYKAITAIKEKYISKNEIDNYVSKKFPQLGENGVGVLDLENYIHRDEAVEIAIEAIGGQESKIWEQEALREAFEGKK